MTTWVNLLPKWLQLALGVTLMTVHNITYWVQIAVLAAQCLYQEVRGEEPDCPDCWKCESMRVLLLCILAFLGTKIVLWVL